MIKTTKLITTAVVMNEASGLQIASKVGLEATKGASKDGLQASKGYKRGLRGTDQMKLRSIYDLCNDKGGFAA